MKNNISFLLLFLFLIANTALAYSVDTHRILSEKAAESSKLALDKGDYLKNLGFQNNIEEKFSDKKVRDLIKDGSEYEDLNANYINHYHNPLKPWTEAGLDDLFTTGQSSLLWAQDFSNEFSWQAVRQYYLVALTASTEGSRKSNFAKTFEGLGHLIHLLQDAAQPAHVRNDGHVQDSWHPLGIEMYNGIETWSNNNLDIIEDFASSPKFPTIDYNVNLPVYNTISQLFDTDPDTYNGTNPSTSLSQGLAEYTNANFLSEDTVFTEIFATDHRHYFPFPRMEDTVKYDEYIESDGNYRTYFKKFRNGETINHLASMEIHYRYYDPWPDIQRNFIVLDDPKCHKDYVQKLIPRAVGYSTELIDYFFRGEMDFKINHGTTSITITNNSTENMNGFFTLYYDKADGTRTQVDNGWELEIPAGDSREELSFIYPDDFAAKQYILVFEGTLGSEDGAVVGKIIDPYWEPWGETVCESHSWEAYTWIQRVEKDDTCPSLGETWTLNEGVLHQSVAGDNAHYLEGDASISILSTDTQNIEATKMKLKISTEVTEPDYYEYNSIISLVLWGEYDTSAVLVLDKNFTWHDGWPDWDIIGDNGGEEQIINLADYGFINEDIIYIGIDVYCGWYTQCSYSLDYIDFYTE